MSYEGLPQKNKKKELLEGYVVIEAYIECTKCGKAESISEIDPEGDAYAYGWRATKNHCYCPKCKRKYLKNS